MGALLYEELACAESATEALYPALYRLFPAFAMTMDVAGYWLRYRFRSLIPEGVTVIKSVV